MKYLKLFETLEENMIFYHGGNLDNYSPIISHKKGRFEYGPGLYATEHLDTARKFAKGSRKLYQLIIEKGNDINDVEFDIKSCLSFIKNYVMVDKRKLVAEIMQEYIKDNKIKGYIFNNILTNNNAIKPTRTKNWRQFLIENGADYEIMHKTYGFNEKMIVLYNMNKIKDIKRI